jgi:hypothetical protein
MSVDHFCRHHWILVFPFLDWPISMIYPIYPLVMTNIAMENGPSIDGLPIKNCDFPWLCWITRW